MRIENSSLTLSEITKVGCLGKEALLRGDAKFDFTAVTRVDSSALAMMLDWIRQAKVAGLVPVFENVPDNLKNLIHLYGLDSLFNLK